MKRFLPILAALALFATSAVSAQVSPGTLTFSASPTSCTNSCTPVLKWSTTPNPGGIAAASCSASSSPAVTGWTGSVATSGTFTSPAVTANTTFNLSCTWTQDTNTFSWLAPTTNTNGTPITLPLTYNVLTGTSSSTITTSLVTGLTALTYTQSNAPAGTNYYAVVAVDSAGTSVDSNTVSTVNGSASTPGTINVVVSSAPSAPGSLTVVISQ